MGILNAFSGKKANPKVTCLELGKRLYHTHSVEFEDYFEEFLEDSRVFNDMYSDVVREFGFKRLDAYKVLYAYGAHYKHSCYLDWRGEENEKEIETFVQKTFPKIEFDWKMSEKLRQASSSIDKRDGKFVVDLFKTIDSDIRRNGYALLFFTIEADGYCFIPTDIETYDFAVRQMGNHFHGPADIKV